MKLNFEINVISLICFLDIQFNYYSSTAVTMVTNVITIRIIICEIHMSVTFTKRSNVLENCVYINDIG